MRKEGIQCAITNDGRGDKSRKVKVRETLLVSYTQTMGIDPSSCYHENCTGWFLDITARFFFLLSYASVPVPFLRTNTILAVSMRSSWVRLFSVTVAVIISVRPWYLIFNSIFWGFLGIHLQFVLENFSISHIATFDGILTIADFYLASTWQY